MERERILRELHESIERLADAVADEPGLASSLRRVAAGLPAPRRAQPWAPPPRSDPSAIAPLLWSALDAGLIDGRALDVAMVRRARAARRLGARYSPPPMGSPSASLSSSGGGVSDGCAAGGAARLG